MVTKKPNTSEIIIQRINFVLIQKYPIDIRDVQLCDPLIHIKMFRIYIIKQRFCIEMPVT